MVDKQTTEKKIPSMYENLTGTIKAKIDTKKNLNKLKRYYGLELPRTIMGGDALGSDFNKAMDMVDSYLDAGQYSQARSYVKSQLQKLLKQKEGTQSYGNIEQRLRKYKNVQ